jgi:hypothetical protein
MKTFTIMVYSDPAHSWGKVKRQVIDNLGLAQGVSDYSYQLRDNVYLEEDCDLTKFFNTYVATTGREPKHTTIYSERCRIRTYERYTPEKAYRTLAGGLS